MTDQEILELPKVWVVGGDGGMGDIGYQNMSKVMLQNRPNVKAVMLDTQVYSNTGGQNSDSTPMLGGNDMNLFGDGHAGQERREEDRRRDVPRRPRLALRRPGVDRQRAQAVQGDPRRPRVPRHRVPAVLHDLPARARRGRRHGADPGAARARLARHAGIRLQSQAGRDATRKRSTSRAIRRIDMDWYETKFKGTNEPYRYTVAHWCATEARFRNHLKKIKTDDAAKLIPLENMLVRITQQDVVYRRYLVPSHRSFVPDFGVYIKVQGANGDVEYRTLSRQLVLFCVERRKAWRMLQSKAGIENREDKAQRAILADVDAGKLSKDELFARARGAHEGAAAEARRPRPRRPSAAPPPRPIAVPPPAPARAVDWPARL